MFELCELAVSYSRFSSENQDEKSANDQDIENTEYAKKNNIKIIEYFRDEAKSGTKTVGRDGFFDMLNFCKTFNKDAKNIQKIRYVLVWKFNRFARNDFDSSVYKNELKKIGIRVISITQRIDDTPEGHLLEGILQNMDAYFSENLAGDIRRGLRNNAKEFKFNGGTPPLGYDVIDKQYVINKNEAKAVQKIFDMYLNNFSLADIAAEMNKLGYLTRFKLPFKATSIFEILGNKKYIGIYEYKMADDTFCYEDVIPAIINKEDFRKVQEMRERNKKNTGSYSAREDYLLSGLIVCKQCGRNYVGMTSQRRKGENVYKYRKYGCGGRNKLQGCKATYINADVLEKYTFNLLKEKIANKDGLMQIKNEVEAYVSSLRKDAKNNVADTQKELRQVTKELQNCLSAVSNGLNSKTMNEKIEYLENRKDMLQKELILSKKYGDNSFFNIDNVLEMLKLQFDNFENLSVEEKKSFFKNYIKKIEVDQENIEFYFNLQSLTDELSNNNSSAYLEPLVRLELTTY